MTAIGAIKTSVVSGNWSSAATWSPAGVPLSTDDVIIDTGDTVTMDAARTIVNVTVNSGAMLQWSAAVPRMLTVNGNFVNNGYTDMCGDLLLASGRSVRFGSNSTFIWNPANNTATGATLFTNGLENFDTTSTLVIRKWYDYTIPLGAVAGSVLGNLKVNTPGNGSNVIEWNQSNYFQTFPVKGTLTIDTGWVTLDRSGSISLTTLKDVVLTSANSTLYGHHGNHAGSFTLAIRSLNNNGGVFKGLNNGTGNIQLNVSGTVTNSGNIKLINNSGVANVGNGNAGITVNGLFLQTAGDTRFIYNVTTSQCGVYVANLSQLTINGGIFFGQTGINTAGGVCSFTVSGNLTLAFSNPTDIFRGISLTAIGANINACGLRMIVRGDFITSGPTTAEFTCSAGRGAETVTVGGNYSVSGLTNNFNFGANGAAHSNNLSITGSYNQNGGFVHLSRLAGRARIQINGNMLLNSGSVSLKSQSGLSTAIVNGNVNVSGGSMYLHYNTTQATPDANSLTVNGTFSHSNGTINFDDNPTNSGAWHSIIIAGPQCNLSGGGVITHAGAGTSQSFGMLSFARAGTVIYTRTNSHLLTQVKQRIENRCTLNVSSGNIQVASHGTAATDYFRIRTGGRLESNSNQLASNALFANCGIQIDSGGTYALMRATGFYNGTVNASVNANRNMDFLIDPYGIVEYNGMMNQVLTGIGLGIASGMQHRYGILNIAFRGPSGTYVAPSGDQVFVRTQLQATSGELFLNTFPITVMNGAPWAIGRTGGYVKSEMNDSVNTSKIVWENIQPGAHIFPFGKDAATYLPMTLTPQTEFGTTVAVSTRGTQPTNNIPLPPSVPLRGIAAWPNPPMLTPLAVEEVVDRWWCIDASPIMTADITVSYPGAENTLRPDVSTGLLGIGNWDGNAWNISNMNDLGVLSGIGTVSATGVTPLTHLIITTNSVTLPVDLLDFTATPVNNKKVVLDWTTASERNSDSFTIERSRDGATFSALFSIRAAGNSSQTLPYRETDESPLSGDSYYRIRQTDMDGSTSYSQTRHVHIGDSPVTESLILENIGPNPFSGALKLNVIMRNGGELSIRMTDLGGRTVYQEKKKTEPGASVVELTGLESVAAGTYVLLLESEGTVITRKAFKQ
jgi:hypothetical protein